MVTISPPVAKSWGLDGAELANSVPALPVVIVCEHASCDIPDALGDLGLDAQALGSHIAWDIGALEVARGLSEQLRVPLVYGTVSRLVYDCNRPFDAVDCIPVTTEKYHIPGNDNLSPAEREERYASVHHPFHAAVHRATKQVAQQCGIAPLLITIHSFTPIYDGHVRSVELGYLYDDNPHLALAALEHEQARNRYRCALNEPYSTADGVTYTLRKHQATTQPASLMLEIKNDLIDTPNKARKMALHLVDSLSPAIAQSLPAEVSR